MTPQHSETALTRPLGTRPRRWPWALLALWIVAIFVADTLLSLEIAVAVFYASVVLVAAPALPPRRLKALAALCCGLTAVSFVISRGGLAAQGDWHAGLVNLGVSVAAIVTTTWLVRVMQAAQAQLLRLARVEHLAVLTGAVAHEINQPLAAIATSGDACQRWLAQQPPNLARAHAALARIRDDAERASDVIARLRSLTRGEPPQPRAFDLNQTVREVVALSHAERARHGITLATALAPDLPPAWADPLQIQQVLANLLRNAAEAVAVAVSAPSSAQITVASKLADGAAVVTVSDSGAGVAPAMQARLFEAFWTTKSTGMGVGLSVSRAMVEANGGQIWLAEQHRAQPAGQRGATFAFSVPLADTDTRSP